MLKLILVVILNSSFFICNCFSQSWYIIDPTTIDGTPNFSDVFFTDENTGWITTGSQANIYKTQDGAASFSTQVTTISTEAIYMIDGNNGYSGGASGFVYNTGDGGLNWPFFGTMATTLTDMDFATSSQGYACGNGGAVFSISGGVNNLNSGQAVNFSGISSPSVDNVWICGGSSIMYYNGTTFTFQSGPVGTYNAIYFINNQEGWVVGNSGVIGHTTNGGNTWTSQTNPDSNSLFDLFFLNANEGWAVGAQGTILHYTTNGGTPTWTVEGTGVTASLLTGVHFVSTANGNIGYVVGQGKTIIKYGTPLATEDEDAVPKSFELKQNFPNPFNPTTTIEYTVSTTPKSPPNLGGEAQQGRYVQLQVYDILGNVVATLIDKEQPMGYYSVNFNVETGHALSLQSGVYFYKLQVGSEVQTKKMLLMK